MGGFVRHREALRKSTPSRLRYYSEHRCSRIGARDSPASEDIRSALCQRPCDQADCAGRRPPRSLISFHEMRSPQSRHRSLPVVESACSRSESVSGATTAFVRHLSYPDAACALLECGCQAYVTVASWPSAPHPRPLPTALRAGGGERHQPASLTRPPARLRARYPSTFPTMRTASSTRLASASQNVLNSAWSR